MFFIFKIIFIEYLYFIIFLTACQLQDPDKNHGIIFLENRSKN